MKDFGDLGIEDSINGLFGIIIFEFRYLFVPLGGSKNKFLNIWIVFTFVAIWHDFSLDLVLWAWFICLCIIPEMLIKKWADK